MSCLLLGILYTSSWGFLRCSFRLTRQCEGLHIVERAAGLAPRLFSSNIICCRGQSNDMDMKNKGNSTLINRILNRISIFLKENKNKIWLAVVLSIAVSASWMTHKVTRLYYDKQIDQRQNKIATLIDELGAEQEKVKDMENSRISTDKRPSILGKIVQCSDIVTTEIHYKQIAKVPIDRGEITPNPLTWDKDKLGTRAVIMPIEVTIMYGFDLSSMSIENIKVDDENSHVWIYLPHPKIISTDFNTHIPKETISLSSSKIAMPPTTEEKEKILNLQKELILKQCEKEFKEKGTNELVINNAKTIFETMLKRIGYKNTTVEIADQNLMHK